MVSGLNDQFMTAFCATTFYNVPAGLGLYPLPKTMRSGALPLFWIIGE
jgi:hypothetical protein